MHPVERLLAPLGRAFRNRRADPSASLANAPELATTTRLELTSSNFPAGGEIPARHCGAFIGEDVSPALAWSPVPEGTGDLVLLFEDLDSPGATPRVHTLAALSPAITTLAEGALVPGAPGVRFAARGRKSGRYAGPRPMPGHGPHRYVFHLYAVDVPVDLARLGGPGQLPAALRGHVLAAGSLQGTRES